MTSYFIQNMALVLNKAFEWWKLLSKNYEVLLLLWFWEGVLCVGCWWGWVGFGTWKEERVPIPKAMFPPQVSCRSQCFDHPLSNVSSPNSSFLSKHSSKQNPFIEKSSTNSHLLLFTKQFFPTQSCWNIQTTIKQKLEP